MGDLPRRPPAQASPLGAVRAWAEWFGVARLTTATVSVGLVAVGAMWAFRAPQMADPLPTVTVPRSTVLPPPGPPTTAPAPHPSELVVHVAGAVHRPGVYALRDGSRLIAAIEAAGGSLGDAALDAVNLASPLHDGQRVYLPTLDEVESLAIGSSSVGGPTWDLDATDGAPAPLVDVNRAEVTELVSLPGIGPATAAAIVDDRERNGPFLDVDDLVRVRGIGPAKLAALRDLVVAG